MGEHFYRIYHSPSARPGQLMFSIHRGCFSSDTFSCALLLLSVTPLLPHSVTSPSPPLQSMVAFLKDPTGAPLWEENPEAKDVVHVESEKVSAACPLWVSAVLD